MSCVAHEQFEEGELGASEVDLATTSGDLPGPSVEGKVLHLQLLAVLDGERSAQQGTQPCQQLLKRKRFHQVVVGACVEAGDAVGHGVPCREHEDRSVVSLRAELPADFEAIDVGHHDVEDQRIGLPTHLVECVCAVPCREHVVALQLQSTFDGIPDARIIVDN